MMLALLTGFLFQLHGADGDEPRTFLWPLGSGYAPYSLLTTYGQPDENGNRLHHALDVTELSLVTGKTSSTVYSLEDGVVRRVFVDPANFTSGVVVESKSKPERAWLYMHLEKGTIRVAEGQEVWTNQILGRLLYVDTFNEAVHVHLARLGGDFRNQRWEEIDLLSERNPLRLLRPEALGDSNAPEVEVVDGNKVRIRSDEALADTSPYDVTAIPASTATRPFSVDVLACVQDRDGGKYPLAPYKLKLTVKDVPALTFHLCLDGPLPDPPAICEEVKLRAHEYRVFYVLTNGTKDCGSAPATANAWQAGVGPHKLELMVEDVAGLQTTVETEVEAESP